MPGFFSPIRYHGSYRRENILSLRIYNLWQKIVDKFMKLSKKVFLWIVLRLICGGFEHICQNLLFGRPPGYSLSNPANVWQLVMQLVGWLSVDNNLVPFHLWWGETEKVGKSTHVLTKIVWTFSYKNSSFRDVCNLGLCCNSVAFKIRFRSKWVFYRKYTLKESGWS